MAVMATKTLMTAEQFLSFHIGEEDDNRRFELLEGHVVVDEPLLAHQMLVRNLTYEFESWSRAGAGRGQFVLNIDTRLDDHNLFGPDAQWYSHERRRTEYFKRPHPPGDIAIEVFSPSTRRRDSLTKRGVYARNGVGELWLFDPEERSVLALRRSTAGGDEYDIEDLLTGDDRLTSPLLPGFAVMLPDLFV